MSERGLVVRGLTIAQGERILLRDVSFRVQPGTWHVLRAPSGTGKTTLLRAITGLQTSQTGSVELDGVVLDATNVVRHRARVHYVPQKPVLFEGTVEENLARPFAYRIRHGATFDRERAHAWLVRMDLPEDAMRRDAQALSHGEAQRVVLTRALLLEPAVFVLDEPWTGLDAPRIATQVLCLQEQLEQRGAAVLMTTHRAPTELGLPANVTVQELAS